MKRNINNGFCLFCMPEFRAFCSLIGVTDEMQRTFNALTVDVDEESVCVLLQNNYNGLIDDLKFYVPNTSGFKLYHHPAFKAFCTRIGFVWDLPSIRMTFKMIEGERPEIIHVYAMTEPEDGQ